MFLRGVDYGDVWNASGARGFFGTGADYWWHRFLRPFGLNYGDATFVSKTTTVYPRRGNLPLAADGITPKHWLPDCVAIRWWKGVVLNAVGLSGPGLQDLMIDGRWQQRKRPWVLSLAFPGEHPVYQAQQAVRFFQASGWGRLLWHARPDPWKVRPAISVNYSCPNTGEVAHGFDILSKILDVLRDLGVPLLAKFSVLASPKDVADFAVQQLDAVEVSNTLPWGSLPEQVDWQDLFDTDPFMPLANASPLHVYGGGGLSGRPLLPLVAEWLRVFRVANIRTNVFHPVIAGGGILHRRDVDVLKTAGASAVSLGVVSILRPWRVAGIVRHAQRRSANNAIQSG